MRRHEIGEGLDATTNRSESRRRRRLFATLLPVLMAAAACCVGPGQALAQDVEIRVLLVGDTHSHLAPVGPRNESLEGTVGGVARAATVIGLERAADPDLLLLHSGDAFVGSLFFNHTFGIAELQLMQAIGVDAMAVGNHDLDFGPETLAYALATAGTPFPLLGANLDLTGYPDLAAWIQPGVITEVKGVKLGLFGLTVPGDPLSQPDPVVVLPDVVAVAQQAVDRLRADGADVVLCLSHLGTPYDLAVASSVQGIDAILGGHDHLAGGPIEVVAPDGSPTSIVRAGCCWQQVGRLRLEWEGTTASVESYTLLPVDASVPPVPQVEAVVASLIDDIEARWPGVFSDQVATAPVPLSCAYDPTKRARDTDMGNLVTDALRCRTGTEIALTPSGLIAESLPAGPMVAEDLFRAVAYGFDPATGLDFPIATFDITGLELLKGLEFGTSAIEHSDEFLVQVSGLRYRYDSSRPAGQRVLPATVHVNGRPLDPSATYSATANLGVVLLLPLAGVEISDVEVLADVELYALRDYVAALGVVTPPPTGRIRDTTPRPWHHDSRPTAEKRSTPAPCYPLGGRNGN